ncbi:hypothetical protein SETIT_3G325700v2 [Setaria italica]|uniref:Exostosin GT47 domain-containing protein n=3 Tax=Setaria TaxID=4554 RepID=A0A368QL89_SETIT|nr:xyloglucan galactosyltransferase KATAMARI1 homolog [Setaria italica]XP_034586736.1 xyloglucan galactosyltransferase KATAMARI1 homolog [Setaria viridis]RCV18726.1 hypothetical protein SETIT_3G325700v2 [Setaria italica]TKW28606.1 hypothetical protein SEVIR_3G340800v2 [Setaria viridis]
MGSGRASAVLRAARWLLPLVVPACCVVWTILFFAPPTPPALDVGRRESFHVSVGEIVGATARRAAVTMPVPEREGIVHASPRLPERQEIIDTLPPPPPERRARAETSPPPPPLPPPEHELIVDASPPPPPKLEEITGTSPPPPQLARQGRQGRAANRAAAADRCAGRYIYVQELPSRFNADLLRNCRSLSEWTDMCRHVANAGMGPRLTRTGAVLPATGWYDTNQFTLEVIFHGRMRQYGCLTADASRADAVYVPYYAGLDVGRHLWGSSNGARDALAEDLAGWLRSTPAWAARGGRDHFLVGGRIAWDFRRQDGGNWGSRLLLLPEAANMTALVLESGPWHAGDVAVPYPTCFHPSRTAEVASCQRALRRARRPWLFAFAGARRPGGAGGGGTLRDAVIGQCARSRRCGLLQCGRGRRHDCYAPGNVVRHFKSAAFCLQPPGDSYTRRSAFDAMLAGCVPVFFHPGSAYTQYRWHLPADHARYSVFVPGDGVRNGTVRVEDVLRRFSRAEVAAMREQVIRMIPSIVYRDPRVPGDGFRDAFDIAVDGMIERVSRIKRGLPPWEEDRDQRRWDGYFDSW